jgi:hypothetical protein
VWGGVGGWCRGDGSVVGGGVENKKGVGG